MTNRQANLIIFIALIIGGAAVAFIIFLVGAKQDFPERVKVSADGVTESTLPIRDLNLIPTESKEYSVSLVCDVMGAYHISLDFNELKDGGLKPHVKVTVKGNGATVFEGMLIDLLDGDKNVEFVGELDKDLPYVVTVVYEMPYDIDTGAQGVYADFDIILKASVTKDL